LAAGPFVALATAGPFVALATAGPFVALASANVPNSIPSIDNEPNESPSISSGNDNIERLWALATTAPRMGATMIRNFMVVVCSVYDKSYSTGDNVLCTRYRYYDNVRALDIKKWSEVQIMASFFSSEALRPRVGSLRLASDI